MDSPTCFRIENRAYKEKTEDELIVMCEADREAFGELARRYQAMAFRAAFCVLRNELDAEDQVQSAFCKAFEHFGDFQRKARFSTWLVRIVIDECLMQVRRPRHAAAVSLEGFADGDLRLDLRDGKRHCRACS